MRKVGISKEVIWTYRRSVHFDLEVKVWTGRLASRAYSGDVLPALYYISHCDKSGREMEVLGNKAIAMRYRHVIACASVIASIR